jgi:NAD(P)H-dependent FMN reductase
MNSLVLLNGSPRGERSNSMKMLSRVAEGWQRGGGQQPEVLHLAHRAGFDRAVQAFAEADTLLLGMPLYTDAMPALVKTYIEALQPRTTAAEGANPALGFLVQSGFPEASHSRPLERYLQKLARRFGSRYVGTIVHGGGESLQMIPDHANEKLWARLRTLGEQLYRDGCFGAEELRAVAGVERMPALTLALARLAVHLPIANFYWNGMLKKNGAWQRRFAAPYAGSGRT